MGENICSESGYSLSDLFILHTQKLFTGQEGYARLLGTRNLEISQQSCNLSVFFPFRR